MLISGLGGMGRDCSITTLIVPDRSSLADFDIVAVYWAGDTLKGTSEACRYSRDHLEVQAQPVARGGGSSSLDQALIDPAVTASMAARDVTRNGYASSNLGTGTEGVVELTQWFERMETMFRISNCFVDNQIKFSTCTLLAGALTWWNSHVSDCRSGCCVCIDLDSSMRKDKRPDKYHVQGTVMKKSDKVESSESVNPGVTNEEMGRFKGPTCFVCGVRGTLQDGLSEAEKINNTVLLRLECQLLQVKVYSVGHARTEPRFQCRDGYVPSQQPLLLLSYLYCAIGDLCPLH
ncbi:hypothetical protein Tco_0477382 [Tanacetum coccineum]